MKKLRQSKLVLVSGLGIWSGMVYAENDLTQTALDIQESQVMIPPGEEISQGKYFINPTAFMQNPYQGMSSGGSSSSESSSRSLGEQQIFSGGTWNVWGGASYVNMNGANNYGYGANLFGQTGAVAGFSLGTLFTAMNPWFSDQLNPSIPEQQAQTLPIAYQVNPQQLFVEYQLAHTLQLDLGYIGINNSPWLTYWQNNVLNLVTYQGGLLNIDPGGGWLITALAFNQVQLLGENSFSNLTLYNNTYNYASLTPQVGAEPSSGSWGLGVSWSDAADDFNLRLWGYQFYGYAQLLYADTTLKLPVNDQLGFSLGVQAAVEGNAPGGNLLVENGYGNSVRSNLIGLNGTFNYKIFGLQLGYNNIWGPSDAYAGGGVVAPYTYQLATDPLYTTGWMLGMVEKSAGQAYKVAPSLVLLDGNLVISPSYQYYATTAIPDSAEYDLTVSYAIPQVRGLTAFAGYGYLTQGEDEGGDNYQWQLMLSYLY